MNKCLDFSNRLMKERLQYYESVISRVYEFEEVEKGLSVETFQTDL
jgi:hypothetical protein